MRRNQIIKVVISALFLAIAISIKTFTIPLFKIGNYTGFEIGLSGVILGVASLTLGPIRGGIIAFFSDIIGFFLFSAPRGEVFFFGYTLNETLAGVIPGLLLYLYTILKDKKVLIFILNAVLIFAIFGVSLIYVFNRNSVISGKPLFTDPKFIETAILVLVIGLIADFLFLYIFSKKFKNFPTSTIIPFSLIVLIRIVIEIINITLTPLWLNIQLSYPYWPSFFLRTFTAVILIPVKSLIMYWLIVGLEKAKFFKILQKYQNNDTIDV